MPVRATGRRPLGASSQRNPPLSAPIASGLDGTLPKKTSSCHRSRQLTAEAAAARDEAAERSRAAADEYTQAWLAIEALEQDVEKARGDVYAVLNTITALSAAFDSASAHRERAMAAAARLDLEARELAAGNVAATGGMAALIGEKEFPTLSHEGEKDSIHISVVGRLLLVVVFDDRSSLGLVKLRSKQVSQQLAKMFDEITANGDLDDPDSPFAGITDEDIDSLFT